jgi:UDP-N-acetylmuramate dehydrogenase
MEIKELVPLSNKTTMRIGGFARYFAELSSREDVEVAAAFSRDHHLPLIILGNGSNTVFAEGTIEALVARIQANGVQIHNGSVTVEAGKNLAMLINELAEKGLDLSSLTGIPGTVGGALFGNAGQGPTGVWVDRFVRSVTVFDHGTWRILPHHECSFAYRESVFKHMRGASPVIMEVELMVPARAPEDIRMNIALLLQKRIETQPHLKTAGSCFKAVGKTPAWKLIDAAGLRGVRIGDVEISTKHANFLLNTGKGTYGDAKNIVKKVRSAIPESLEVEMRFIETDGSLAF